MERSPDRDFIGEFLFRPLGRGSFLCSAKEKYPKEKRTRRLARYADSLCFSDFWAFAQLAGRKRPRPAQTGGLTCSQKPCDARLRPREWGWRGLIPLVQPSTAGKTGLSAPPVRARSERKRDRRVGRAPVFPRSTGNPEWHVPFRASLRAAFSLGTFSWPRKRKYLARKGRNKTHQCRRQPPARVPGISSMPGTGRLRHA